MEVTELIKAFQSHLSDELEPQVLVAGSGERPVPSIHIEDWAIEQMDASMNRYLTSTYDDRGFEQARVYRLPYSCRVSMVVRGRGDLEGSKQHDALRKELLKLEAHPDTVADEVSQVVIQGGGGIQHQFVSPTESEFQQDVRLMSALIWKDTDYENIEEVVADYEIIESYT